jgi:hypothetical protein
MKSNMRKLFLFSSVLILSAGMVYSQLDKIGSILAGGVGDAELMMTEYIRPLTNSLGANLNAGWYNTAKPHKLGGFDITFTFNVAIAPEDHLMYNLDEIGLSDNIRYDDNIAKTFPGAKGSGPTIGYAYDVPVIGEQEIDLYDHPGGVGFKMVPSPMINASLGLIKGTEVMGRYMPSVNLRNVGKFNLWGIGVKHDLKQWIPVVNKIPVLHLGIMYGYTKMKVHTDLPAITPADLNATENFGADPVPDWNDQGLDLEFNSHTANLLISANLPVVCFYGGAGISISKANLMLNGPFPVPTAVRDGMNARLEVGPGQVETDPFDIEIENQDGGVTKPRFNAGIRFKFTVITLHVDYTRANYNVLTAGLGISVR